MPNDVKGLEDNYVAYIDILGYKKKMREVNSESNFLKQIQNAFNDATRIANENNFSGVKKVNYRIFSDNIVLSIPVVQEVSFAAICQYSWAIQCSFINNGFLVRGGISSGMFFQNGEYVFGKGLIETYELESQVSVFPRIVIDRKLLEKTSWDYQSNLILQQDSDGYYFISYLDDPRNQNVYTEDGKTRNLQNTSLFQRHKSIIEDGLQKEVDNRIMQKLLWCAKYHNSRNAIRGTDLQISNSLTKLELEITSRLND